MNWETRERKSTNIEKRKKEALIVRALLIVCVRVREILMMR